jgi:hypothetical protein
MVHMLQAIDPASAGRIKARSGLGQALCLAARRFQGAI